MDATEIITEEVKQIEQHNEEIKSTSDPEPEKETTKPKRIKTRHICDLIEASTRTMSDKEKNLLIKYLKEEYALAQNKIIQLQNNAEQAYKKSAYTEDNMKSMETYFNERLGYISDAAKTFYKSILLATKGDVK